MNTPKHSSGKKRLPMDSLGRPSLLTKKRQAEFCRAIRAGAAIEAAAAYVGLAPRTVFYWLSRGRRWEEGRGTNADAPFGAFLQALSRALAEVEVDALASISRASKGGHWQAAAWKLERRFPERWGRHRALEVTHHHTVEYGRMVQEFRKGLEGLSDAEAEQMAALEEKRLATLEEEAVEAEREEENDSLR